MKRMICAVVAAGLLAAGPLAGRAFAEDEGAKDAGRRGEHAESRDKDGRGDHADKMMKERLGLSDDQAAKLKSAFDEHKKAEKALREDAKTAERKLEEEVRGLASDKDIQATLDQLDAGRKAMTDQHQKFEASLASILKPYQRAKMRLLMFEHMKRDGKEGRRKSHWSGERRHHDDDETP